MIKPIKVVDPRRATATRQILSEIDTIHKSLAVVASIPFDVPLIITQILKIEDFDPFTRIIIAHVQEMTTNVLKCVVYASDNVIGLLDFDVKTSTIKIPFFAVSNWRLLDRASLGTTVNYAFKTTQYSNLYNMDMPEVSNARTE